MLWQPEPKICKQAKCSLPKRRFTYPTFNTLITHIPHVTFHIPIYNNNQSLIFYHLYPTSQFFHTFLVHKFTIGNRNNICFGSFTFKCISYYCHSDCLMNYQEKPTVVPFEFTSRIYHGVLFGFAF